MKRENDKIAVGAMVAPLAGFTNETVENRLEASESGEKEERVCMKKYTNADYYKDGVFQKDVAFRAFYEMFEGFGYALADKLRTFKEGEFWVVDFGLGDFENVGMGGIIWYNDKVNAIWPRHLPSSHQMIAEHYHLPAEGFRRSMKPGLSVTGASLISVRGAC